MMEGNAMKMMISETAIDDIARVCHEVNRAYCEGLGDYTQAPWEDAPEWQRASARMGVDLHLRGDFGPEASHISWMKQKLEEGWTHGPVKDPGKKEHPCMVPFDELPLEQQLKDHLFRAVVHALRPRTTTAHYQLLLKQIPHTEIAEFVNDNESVKAMVWTAQADLKEKDMNTDNALLRGEPPRFDPIEQEIQAKGLTAPRITPADIEGNIAREFYFNAGDAVYPGPVVASPYEQLRLLTFCVLVLRNGFTVTGESACASPENFDAEIGRKIARQKAVEKIWPLMGYELRSKLAWRQGPRTGEQEGGAA